MNSKSFKTVAGVFAVVFFAVFAKAQDFRNSRTAEQRASGSSSAGNYASRPATGVGGYADDNLESVSASGIRAMNIQKPTIVRTETDVKGQAGDVVSLPNHAATTWTNEQDETEKDRPAKKMQVNMVFSGKDWTDCSAKDKTNNISVQAYVTAADQQFGYGQRVTLKVDNHKLTSIATIGPGADEEGTVFMLESLSWNMFVQEKKPTHVLAATMCGKDYMLLPQKKDDKWIINADLGKLIADKKGIIGEFDSRACGKNSVAALSYFLMMLAY
ncbi:MAG: hypothetical protein HY746_04110 [Elusimicrobia bacterium]|nr:hypothetical protein [Elusimicrobiota bacterium]